MNFLDQPVCVVGRHRVGRINFPSINHYKWLHGSKKNHITLEHNSVYDLSE